MTTLVEMFRGLVCDLDGVVYRGAVAVPHAAESLNAAKAAGIGTVFATNNASRTPQDVGDQLRSLGVEVTDDYVLTSSIAGSRWLADRFEPGSVILAIGGGGVAEALTAAGLTPVLPDDAADAHPVAVLQGYGTDVTAGDLAQAAYAIARGALWVATNNDLTLPTEFGIAPGNGSLVNAVGCAVDSDPEVIGKPGPLMYQIAADQLRTDAATTLGIGDRLETDTAGAHAAGMDILHVLTGVHGPCDLVAAPQELRPRFVAPDLRALGRSYEEPHTSDRGGWSTSAVQVRVERGELIVDGDRDRPDALRAALKSLWAAIDDGSLEIAAAQEQLRTAKLDATA